MVRYTYHQIIMKNYHRWKVFNAFGPPNKLNEQPLFYVLYFFFDMFLRFVINYVLIFKMILVLMTKRVASQKLISEK